MTSFFISLLLSFAATHPYYVSIIEVEHHPDTKTFQVAVKLFIDDIEDALVNNGTEKPNFGTDNELPNSEQWLFDYLNEHLKIQTDGKTLEFDFLGKELDNEAMWCYLESEKISKVDTLNITATLLIDEFATQSNIVHLKIWDTKTSMIFRKSRTEKELVSTDFH